MLTVTSSAADLVSTIRQEQGVPDDFGLRVYAEPGPQGVEIQLAFAPEPQQGDEVSESAGLRMFVASELTEPLADSVIDAQETPDGAGLMLRESS